MKKNHLGVSKDLLLGRLLITSEECNERKHRDADYKDICLSFLPTNSCAKMFVCKHFNGYRLRITTFYM